MYLNNYINIKKHIKTQDIKTSRHKTSRNQDNDLNTIVEFHIHPQEFSYLCEYMNFYYIESVKFMDTLFI